MHGMRVVRVDHSTHGFRRRVTAMRRVTMIRANQFTGVPNLTSIREIRNVDCSYAFTLGIETQGRTVVRSIDRNNSLEFIMISTSRLTSTRTCIKRALI